MAANKPCDVLADRIVEIVKGVDDWGVAGSAVSRLLRAEDRRLARAVDEVRQQPSFTAQVRDALSGEHPESAAFLAMLGDEVRREIERLEKESDQLRAIVDKLPRTADGVVVVPGMDLYKRVSHKDGGPWVVVQRPRADAIEANGIVRRHGHESGWLERASDLYASRSAATGEEEQAAEPQPDSPKPTCETCRFWWGRKIDGCGDCQRFPPTHDQDGLGVFPLNYAESWCGEHQPQEEDK